MDEVDTILTKLLVQGERLTGKINSLAVGLEHNERDIREMNAELKKFKDTAWDKMNGNKDLITKLDKGQGELIVKLGFWPKIFVCIATLLSLISTIIALFS